MNQIDNVTELDEIFQSLYSIMHNNDELIETENLKPILKNIIKLLLVVHLIDLIIFHIFSIIYGLDLIRKILSIPFVKEFDQSRKFAYRSLAVSYIILTLITLTGNILLNKESLIKIIDPQSSISTRFSKFFQIFGMIIGFSHNIIMPLLFIYTMMLFKFCIQRLIDNYAMVDNLDEINMIKLRAQLSDLNDRFKEILPYFSMPLTGMFASSIFIVISSSCFLMINNTSHSHYYISFVFCLGLIAFLSLIIVACFGNLPENCCRDLVRIVYENLQQWHLNEWMCFMEIKRLQKEFIVDIFSMYTVQQSSILAMLGFALNYIVILLQTENYTSANNSTILSNITNETIVDNLMNENLTKQMLIESDYHHNETIFDANEMLELF
ncbi:uncharacterized protein LOC113789037 [Dermatophagoides pteronyssinus]|uniref:uncharacterized protein LOC113789037 n=1 Tax=Dermatophagoides pteronyssinus TaxID=6956 RepID=UPI003F673B33